MAKIIPQDEKVFMVSKSTNTTYSGSASLKAMQEWYTMEDVIATVGSGSAPTLQQVVDQGNVVNGTPIVLHSDGQTPIVATSGSGVGVSGASELGYGIQGQSIDSYGGYFSSSENIAIYGISQNGVGSVFESSGNDAIRGYSGNGIGVYGSSTDYYGGYFFSSENHALVANGTAAKPGGGSWDSYSDSRVKENIKPYLKGLAEIVLVNPVNYEYNGLANTTKGTEYTGIIAQEIKDIFPETVTIYKAKLNEEDEKTTELYNFNSTALTFALINAVKELNEKIKILEAK